MFIRKFEDEIAWKENRLGKITGSKLKDIVVLRGNNPKIGFYELIADKLAIPRKEGEDKMNRGHELEPIALELAEKELGKTFNKDLVVWEREDDPNIAISPDGFTEDLTEAAEVKCLGSARQIMAIINNEPEQEYKWQYLQYFIVNDNLKTLYVVMYDPSFIEKLQLKIFTINRSDLQDDIDKYLEYQRQTLNDVNRIVKELSF
jgi:hypothetical protein